jgi:hypothetical protein
MVETTIAQVVFSLRTKPVLRIGYGIGFQDIDASGGIAAGIAPCAASVGRDTVDVRHSAALHHR